MTKPILQALLLADYVYQDAASGKKIIAGTFNRLSVRQQAQPMQEADSPSGGDTATPGETPAQRKLSPAEVRQAGSPYAFISLTDIHGVQALVLRYVALSDNNVLLQTEFQVQCDDPLQTVEVILPLPRLPTPAPGTYAVELLCADAILGSLRVTVDAVP